MVISSASYPHQGAAGCSLWRLMTRTMLLGKFEDAIMSITCSLGHMASWSRGDTSQDTVSGKGKRSPSYSILKIPHRRSTSTSTLWVSPSFPISMTSSPWHLALLLGTGLLSKRLNFRRQSSMSSALASWFIASFGGFQSLYRGTPQIIHFNRIFHYKPSSYWGTPHFRKPPSCDLQTWMVEWLFSQWRARFELENECFFRWILANSSSWLNDFMSGKCHG